LDSCLVNDNVQNQSEEIRSGFNLPLTVENLEVLFYWYKQPIKSQPFSFTWEKRPCKKFEKSQYDKLISLKAKETMNLDFEEKQFWFYNQLEKLKISWMNGSDHLSIRKDYILEDTIKEIETCDLHKELKIMFKDEIVLDAGGLMREWISLIMGKFAEGGLFEKADTENFTYKLRCENDNKENMLQMAKVFGLVLGKALFEKVPVQLYLDRTLIRSLMGQEVELEDVYTFDKGLYRSWQFLKENNVDNLNKEGVFDEKFEVFYKGNEKVERMELKPNGENIRISESNKDEYVQLCVEFYTRQIVIGQLSAFLEGFYKVIPLENMQILNPNEVEMLLYGVPIINLQDWKSNTIYKGAYYENHQIIQWFWEVLNGFNQQQLAKILHFCTGSSRTPIDGFRNLMSNRGKIAKFCIESCKCNKNLQFPIGHTCFNRLELPMYSNKEILKGKMEFLAKSQLEGVFGLE